MANERDRLKILKEIENAQKTIARIESNVNDTIEERNAKSRAYKSEIVSLAKELKKVNQEQLNTYSSAEAGLGSISGAYSNLKDLQKAGLALQQQSLSAGSKEAKAALNIQDINQRISQLGRDDVMQRAALLSQRNDEMDILGKQFHGNSKIIQNLKEQNSLAKTYSNLTDYQKSQMENTHKVMEGIKGTISGVLDVFSTLTSGPMGFLGTALIGAGFAMDKISETARETGYFFNEMAVSATLFGLVFKEAQAVAKGLSTELGGVEQATFGAQLNANLLAVNLNLGGAETAKLIGGFARLGDGTAQAGADMAQLVHDASKAAGVIPADVAGDLAANTEKFAEYGKDGGKNMIQAAIAARQLGLEMSSLTNVTDGLLDIENSLTSELELGALLGKNINFEQARRLAYEGEIGSAVKSAIQQLGGVEEFNKMDIYQKREAAKALGLSVEELQKMTSNMDKLNADGSLQVSTFDRIGQTLSAVAKGPLGSFMKGVGGAAVAMGQMGFDVKSMASKVPVLGKLFDKLPGKGAAAGGAPSVAKTPTVPKGGGGAIGGKGSITQSLGKINMTAVLKGAAALLVVAAAVFVFGKAVQEFMKVSWSAVGMAVVSMLALVGSVALLGAIMSSGVGAVAIIAGAAAMLIVAGAMFVLGKAIQEIAKGAGVDFTTLGTQLLAFGLAVIPLGLMALPIFFAAAALTTLGIGLAAFGAGLRMIPTEPLTAIESMITNLLPMVGGILSLAAGITALAGSLALLGVAGLSALPALMGLSLIGGIAMGLGSLFGGGEEGEGGSDPMDAVVTEIKGLRGDLNAGKIAVYLNGEKVTRGIKSVVDDTKVNSYGLG